MPTLKKRINITIAPEIEEASSQAAFRDRVPQATKAAELLRLALEIEEDIFWDTFAAERDTKKAKYVSHKKAWQ